jgi:hypothetical protein
MRFKLYAIAVGIAILLSLNSIVMAEDYNIQKYQNNHMCFIPVSVANGATVGTSKVNAIDCPGGQTRKIMGYFPTGTSDNNSVNSISISPYGIVTVNMRYTVTGTDNYTISVVHE